MTVRERCRRFWRGSSPGFTLVELMAVVVILGLLATVVVQTVPDAVARAKRSALSANLSALQGAVDRFYSDSNVYPTYSGDVPASQPDPHTAVEVRPEAACPGEPDRHFLGNYVQFMPTGDAVALGLDPALGGRVYWGLVRSGLVFCTQVPPDQGAWADGAIRIHTLDALEGRSLAEIMSR
ncbi:MAG: prepilin-type N-terminal cleavage/methylation domain-containing protein [Bacillota bacterium]|nr:prepilin-type N-terminal cleavage/methylation domain-containing protein [Bacillota bacterium]